MSKQPSGTSDLQAIRRKRDMRRKTIPALAQAGPVSIWMILFVTLPMLFIIYISFMSRGVFGDVVYQFSLESYQTLLDATYFKIILKSLKAALLTTVLCLGLGLSLIHILRKVAGFFRESGCRDVTVKLYPGGRHEMLNEINRDTVYQDVLDWLELHIMTKEGG